MQAVKATAFLVLIAELMVLIVIIPFSRTWHIKKKQINYRFSFDQKLVLDRRNFCLYSQVKVTGRLTAPVGDRAAVPAGRRPGRSCQVRPCAGPTGGCALISRALRFIRSNFDNKGFISVTLTPSRKTPRTPHPHPHLSSSAAGPPSPAGVGARASPAQGSHAASAVAWLQVGLSLRLLYLRRSLSLELPVRFLKCRNNCHTLAYSPKEMI